LRKNLTAAAVLVFIVGAVYLFIRFTLPGGGIRPLGEDVMSKPVLSEPQTREMDLFFADVTGRRLSIERREITGDNREDLLKRVVEELIKGPADEDRTRTLPESTLVRAIFTREQTVWVDLGGAIQDEHPGGAWTEVLAVYSIVNTLTENFPNVLRVQILINGRESETFAGHVDISTPLENRIQLLAGDWE
jgi:spore germination protein GerM